jgi:hypothetical protein
MGLGKKPPNNKKYKVLNHVIKYKDNIQTVKQRHRKKYIYETKTINLYFLLLGGFFPRPITHSLLLRTSKVEKVIIVYQ